ncbi:chromosome segregation protein SMC [Nisaea nitritireducens]|uniref:chromosome segregation protein SMC n=1 Tax=Nisaea nitritireducens TaxID=568392 RepID=UPI001867691F|nr:chromosome segregation protein SMC [Nisaea nitritireducens]
MHLSKLRLSGFKSFVDPTELLIEEGMTGVVGPNGCGKSNLVEALRWVMGETSAKQMRGGEMDDVIFGGTTGRPARNLAEVGLLVNNEDRKAPAALNDAPELEVIRRIERNKGSAYRVNGREVRARDVQLLFADAGTGARSAGLVSQGRIGAIINAKPSERRILLEEAANIRGLYTRRREAELRLRAAETNLERLEDVLKALEGQLHGLRQQAKQAQRYRTVAEQMRSAESVLLHRRWEAIKEERAVAGKALAEAGDAVAEATRKAAEASTIQTETAASLPSLREDEAKAAAKLQRLTLARAELDNEERRIVTAKSEAELRLRQIADDLEREQLLSADAEEALQRLKGEHAEIAAAREGEAEAQAEASEALTEINRAADALETKLSEMTEHIATTEARRASLQRQARMAREQIERLTRQIAGLEDERQRLKDSAAGPGEIEAAEQAVTAAEAALEAARSAADGSEAAREAASEAEGAAREALQQVEAGLARLTAEAGALEQLLSGDGEDGDAAPILDSVSAEPGYEAALGAALGDDLTAPLAESGGDHVRYWSGKSGTDSGNALPDSVEPLAKRVTGPAALARRLAATGVVADFQTAKALQPALRDGQRLVSRDGGLCRWDGFVVAPGAPSSAAVRLQQRNRLGALQSEIAVVEKDRAGASERFDVARTAQRDAVDAEKAAREAMRAAFTENETARTRRSKLAALLAEIDSKLSAIDDTKARYEGEIEEAERQRVTAEAAEVELDDVATLRAESAASRQELAETRNALADARSAHDRLMREAEVRRTRLSAIDGELRSWSDRNERAASRKEELADRQLAERTEIGRLEARPSEIETQRKALIDQITQSEAKRKQAADVLSEAEARQRTADEVARQADRELSEARETHIRAEGALEQINQAINGLRERIAERLECRPDEILEKAGIDPEGALPDADEVSNRLERLTKERERIGAVNLRAEQEVEELEQRIAGMESERDDLIQAISRLRGAIQTLNREGRERLLESFERVNAHFKDLFSRLFGGGQAHLKMVEDDDPLDAGLEIMASPPGKKMQVMSLLSGGEQALTAVALVFAAFLTNPSPICVLDEVDAPLDDTNVDRFCTLLQEISKTTGTRFLVITHHRLTMARMDRLFGVTMAERGVSQLVSVDLAGAVELQDVV